MKKPVYTLLFISCLSAATASAQSLSIGGSFNYLSEGVLLNYEIPLNANWHFDAGLRVQMNTFAINKNRRHYDYYQCGYALYFPEYFGLNFRITRKIITYKFAQLAIMSNLLVTRQSLLSRSDRIPIFYDSASGIWNTEKGAEYTNAALSTELTIGLKLNIALTRRISLTAASGIGAIYMNYSHRPSPVFGEIKGKSKLLNIAGPGEFEGSKGDWKMVGLGGGLPMMFLGVTYKLK